MEGTDRSLTLDLVLIDHYHGVHRTHLRSLFPLLRDRQFCRNVHSYGVYKKEI